MSIFLVIILYFVAEIYFLVKVWSLYGFVNTFFALLAFAVLGAGIARNQGKFILRNFQDTVARGQVPAEAALHGMFVFLGGLLFLIPGFVSDMIAVFFVLPGLRHLLVGYVGRRLQRHISGASHGGGFRVFTYSDFGASHKARDMGARDVSPKVIDIKPLSSIHRNDDD